MRRLAVIALVALVLPAIALAAPPPAGNYRGNVTDDSGKVTFKVVGSKLRKFKIDSVGAICPNGFLLVFVHVPEAKIRRDGTFHRRYRPNPDVNQKVTLDGRFRRGKAEGTVQGGPRCEYEASWIAKHVPARPPQG